MWSCHSSLTTYILNLDYVYKTKNVISLLLNISLICIECFFMHYAFLSLLTESLIIKPYLTSTTGTRIFTKNKFTGLLLACVITFYVSSSTVPTIYFKWNLVIANLLLLMRLSTCTLHNLCKSIR